MFIAYICYMRMGLRRCCCCSRCIFAVGTWDGDGCCDINTGALVLQVYVAIAAAKAERNDLEIT